jgi:hypothetical protein
MHQDNRIRRNIQHSRQKAPDDTNGGVWFDIDRLVLPRRDAEPDLHQWKTATNKALNGADTHWHLCGGVPSKGGGVKNSRMEKGNSSSQPNPIAQWKLVAETVTKGRI